VRRWFVSELPRAVIGRLAHVHPIVARLCSAAALLAALAGASFAQQPDAVRTIVAENAALTAQNDEATTALDLARGELEALHKARGDIDERMERIERRAEVHAIGQEFARTLVLQLRQLPRPDHFDRARKARAPLLTATSDANLRAEDALRELTDLDASVQQRLAVMRPTAPAAERQQHEDAVRTALIEQRDLLKRLIERQRELFRALRAVTEAESDLDRHYQAAHAKLTEILYWIPAPPGLQTVSEIPAALAWTVSPANWRSAAKALGEEVARQPVWPAAAVVVAIFLLAARRWLLGTLVALAPASVKHQRYRVGHALAALACTAALAAPGPIVLWTAATLLGSAPDANPFVLALSDALAVTLRLLLALSAFAWLLDRRGVAVNHFGADATSTSFAARALRRFRALFVPLIFVTALNGLNHVPWAHRESLGRLSFILAMLATAAFLVYLLRRKSPLIRQVFVTAPRSLVAGTHGFWLTALVAFPLAIAGLATVGYFVVAAFFFGRMLVSLFLVLAAISLYGLMALWVQVQRGHLARRQDEQATRLAAAEATTEAGSDIADVPLPRLDLAALGEQTRSLLDLLVTALLLAGLWWLWKDALPNLSVVGDYTLWTVSEIHNGKEITRPLAVNSLLLAIVATAVTAVVVRNVGALLDIALLQRFDMQADATYAIKVIARYVSAAVGVALVSRILSINWSDAQWLIAALGVGLGFGLQEIVANFVSGLIVLTERPVRIGDTITVGTITGRVVGIKARATVVVDSESREVIIPNKSFITERVVNWTLSDRTTRLLLKIRVADGADIALVQRVLLDAVRSNPDVMRTPAASVFFVGFGDSALDFEIRAFVDSLDKRLRVQHEIYAAAERALHEHGIGIPFPQRDMHVQTTPAAAIAPKGEAAS
jgi:potassium efflux system protein